jgi:hypothetical protein
MRFEKCIVLTVILLITIALPVFADTVNVSVDLTDSEGVTFIGASTAQRSENYSFLIKKDSKCSLNGIYANISGTLARNFNTGEGTQSAAFLPAMTDSESTPGIEMVNDNDSPMAGVLGYKRIITDSVNAGTITTYHSLSIDNALAQQSDTISWGYWIKESDVGTVFGSKSLQNAIYFESGYLIMNFPLQNLIDTQGTAAVITPTAINMSKYFSSYSVTAQCLKRDSGWAYIACNIENITYASTYSSSNAMFYFNFSLVSSSLRTSGAKIEMSNLSFITGEKISSGYIVYPQEALAESYIYALNKNNTQFSIPKSCLLGDVEIKIISTMPERKIYNVTKDASGAVLVCGDKAVEKTAYDISIELTHGASLTRGYAEIAGTAPINRNTGEGTYRTLFLNTCEDTAASPGIELTADNDSPLAGYMTYKHVITDSVYVSATTYQSVNIANIMAEKPSCLSWGFWIKESDVESVYGENPFVFMIYRSGNYMEIEVPIADLISIMGTSRSLSPNCFNIGEMFTGYDINAKCLHSDGGWVYIVCNVDNILYAPGYQGASTLFYFNFANVSTQLRANNAKIEISNFSFLSNSIIESGYLVYPQSFAEPIFKYILSKNSTSYTLPASFVTGDITVKVTASLGIGDSTITASDGIFDKNLFSDNHMLNAYIDLNGNNILNISCDGVALASGKDYSFENGTCTFKTSFLNGLALGSHSIEFEMDYGTNPGFTFAVVNTSSETREVLCEIDNNNISVRTAYDDTRDLIQRFTGLTEINHDKNAVINFANADLVAKTVTDNFAVGTTVGYSNDDAPPIKMNYSYIGANHGQSSGVLVTSTAHGKTYADIGSIWKDSSGVKWNLLKVPSENNLLFLSENIGGSATKYYFKASISGNLTYEGFGKNTSDITVESMIGYQQIYSSVRHTKKEVYAVVGGMRYLMSDGDVCTCDFVEIAEEYDIINPATIGDALRAARPTDGYTEPQSMAVGDVILKYKMIYRINSDGTVFSIFEHQFCGDVLLDWYGGLQYLGKSDKFGGGVYRYIPKMLPFSVNGVSYDFTTPKNVTTGTVPDLTITSQYWEKPDSKTSA